MGAPDRLSRRRALAAAALRAGAAALGALVAGLLALGCAAGLGGLAAQAGAAAAPPSTDSAPLAEGERAQMLLLGPWPPAPMGDPANPASHNPQGIALGQSLFHSVRLADSGGVRCASCHEPWRRFTDGRPRALGLSEGARNTPTLLNAAAHRHFGWDGANDELWQQSLRPLRDAREMPASAAHVAALMRGDAALAAGASQVFGTPAGADDEAFLRDAGLALAAYVETLATVRTPFDDWRDALAAGNASATPAFPPAALRGLRLFVGRGGCDGCHGGPALGDDAFHVSLIHSIDPAGRPDTGRAAAPPNSFRTPGLREAAATAPYMHDGSVASLCDAVRPHALRADGLPAPALTLAERRDVVAFLRTLLADPSTVPAAADLRCAAGREVELERSARTAAAS